MKTVLHSITCACLVLGVSLPSDAATFPGNARVEIQDPTGGLSWSNSINALTVSCWFKLSIPSTVTLAENMTILANSRDGNEDGTYAYLLRYNIYNGTVEFVTKGGSGAYTNALIRMPYLDRWYHVAVVRSGGTFYGYVDGDSLTPDSGDVGNTRTTNGVSIGGWGNGKYLYGEVQEVAIYQSSLNSDPAQQRTIIRDRMYKDQRGYAAIKGYYKLGYSTNSAEVYNNFVPVPPTNTNPGVKVGSGEITFEETDQGGEQSAFDSRRNKGEDSIAPLSGAFSWDHPGFSRPGPGIGFDFRISYGSANASSGIGGSLGPGWRHSFDTRIIPEQSASERRVLNWDGSVESWMKTGTVYRTRHREYRGELTVLPNADYEWVTPNRLMYRFKDPTSADAPVMAGRLYEIRDFNSNVVQILWNEGDGYVTQVVDTVGGVYNFNYDGQLFLTNVSFQSWSVNFGYDGTNLVSKSMSGPGTYSNLNTRWSFQYNARGFLELITDPRSNAAVRVFYDKYGRMTNEVDALSYTNTTAYGVPDKRQITRTDAEGQKWVETFDRKGRPLSHRNPLGHTTTYVYDERGNIISETDPLGWRTCYGYDERSNKTAETNALGLVTLWTYHSFFNKPVQAVDPLSWVMNYEYDAAGNLIRQYDAIGNMVSYTYTTNGLVQTSTDGNGNTSRLAYTPDGFLASATDPLTNVTRFAHNELGWPLAVTNALGYVTMYSYDINGKVVRTVDPLNRVVAAAYDPNGNLLSQSDAKGQLTVHAYDAEDQKTQTVDRAGAAWRTTWTPRGQAAAQVDPLSNTNRFFYDAANRVTNVVDTLSNSESYQYDANDNRIASIDKLGRRWSTTFDRLDRPVAKSDPLGNTVETAYDAAGRIKTITSPNGYPSTHEYDGRGRLRRWVDAENYAWLYDYDGNGNITNVTDALGGHYVMEYGKRNERTLERNQDTNEWRYVYDELLRLKQQQDPNGLIRAATYDPGSRPTEVNYSSGRIDSYSYDENNNPEVAVRTGSSLVTTTLLTFDVMDRIVQYRDHFGNRVKYAYDLRGSVTNLIYPGNLPLNQTFDALGRLVGQSDWAGRQMAYSYDKAGRLVARTYPNGIVQTNAFDEAGRAISFAYKLSSSNDPLIALSYAYDKNGNKTRSEEKGTLDWQIPSKIDETARYTAANRLIDRVDAANTNRSFVYHYDKSGNMTNAVSAGQSFTLAYDEDNRVTSLFWEAGLTDKLIANRYDVLGRRLSRKLDGVETRYILNVVGDMERILCDQNAAGQITAYYVHGPDLCYAVDTAGNVVDYHSDAMANITALSDSNKTIVAQYAYTPYGRILGSAVTGNCSLVTDNFYLFVGSQGVMQELPAADLYFMRARYYSAEAGVFLSTDPVKYIGPGWKPSAYGYAGDNPLGFADPEGRKFVASGAKSFAKNVVAGLKKVEKALSDNVKQKEAKVAAAVMKQTIVHVVVTAAKTIAPKSAVAQKAMANEQKAKAQVAQAKQDLAKAKTALSDFKKAKESPTVISVKQTTGGNTYSLGTDTINWNPDKQTGGKDAAGRNTRPAYIGLGHEAQHAYDDAIEGTTDMDDPSSDPAKYPNRAEERAVWFENQIRWGEWQDDPSRQRPRY